MRQADERRRMPPCPGCGGNEDAIDNQHGHGADRYGFATCLQAAQASARVDSYPRAAAFIPAVTDKPRGSRSRARREVAEVVRLRRHLDRILPNSVMAL